MKFRRLEVEHFGCIDLAHIEFGPGLNVLYGPNDLGKSTLAKAIRAVLLMPATSGSSDRKAFVPWHSGQAPRVRLSFEHHGQVWRVEKTFAESRGAALLEHSVDGDAFSKVHGAREVDAELRHMLGWGIREPGGRLAPRGLPSSFITTALLGQSSRIEEVFDANLAQDTDPTGRARLTEALQALAEDPRFKRMIALAQAKVDESKTASGKWRTGRDSPMVRVSERIRQLSALQAELARAAEDSERVHETVAARLAERDQQVALRDRAAQTLAELQRWHDEAAAWRAHEHTTRVLRERVDQLRADELRLRGLDLELDSARNELGRAEAELQVQATTAERARDQLRQAEAAMHRASEGGDALSQLHAQKLATRRLELEREQQQLHDCADRIEQARAAVAQARDAADKAAGAAAALHEAKAEAARLRTVRDQATADVELANAIMQWISWRDADARRQQIDRDASQAQTFEARAQEQRAAALGWQAELAGVAAPDREFLRAARVLEQRLRRAEDRTAVGLAVHLAVLPGVVVGAQIDGVERGLDADAGDNRCILRGARELVLDLGTQGKVTIAAGSAAAQSELAAARAAWQTEIVPALQRHAAKDLDELQTRWDREDGQRQQIAQALALAETFTAQAQAFWRSSADRPDIERQCEALADGLTGWDRSQLAATAGDMDATAARARGLAAQAALTRCSEALGAIETQSAVLAGDLARLGDAAADAAERAERTMAVAVAELERGGAAEAMGERAGGFMAAEGTARTAPAPTAPPAAEGTAATAPPAAEGTGPTAPSPAEQAAALARGSARLAERTAAVQANLADVDRALAGLTQTQLRAQADAAQALVEATAGHERAAHALVTAEARVLALRERIAAASGRKADVEARLAGIDGDGLRRELASWLADAPAAPPRVVEAQELDDARAALDGATAKLEQIQAELQKAEGRLESVGGLATRARAIETEQALVAAKRHEDDLRRDYEAWELLRDTLREVETSEGQHLGHAVASAVESRLGALTARRYGRLELDRDLRTAGLRAAGSARNIDQLSAGLKEQLATLVRLAIAEHLGSAVVLDDHLTQTDETRVGYFRQLLHEMADKLQIVVLTCRPADYVVGGVVAGVADPPWRDVGQVCRVVDLAQVIRRAAE